MTGNPDPASAGWHVDRRIPLAIICALIVQTAAVVWWAATTEARIGRTEATLIEVAQELADVRADYERDQAADDLRLRNVELVIERTSANIQSMQTSLARIERLLEAMP